MSGKHITKQQVHLYMKNRKNGSKQAASAAKAGISERSGRRIERDQLQPQKNVRKGRSRKDPLIDVWESELVPKLEKEPQLSPITLLEVLQQGHPNKYPDNILRTLQRRVKNWKALHGPEKEVMFLQEHPVGKQGLSDFTKLKNIKISIKGEAFDHLLYHFRLAFSGWSYMRVICGGESYTALTTGLQEALWRLGGAPFEHRTDHLSAAFKNKRKKAEQDEMSFQKKCTERYEEFCAHYKMKPTHNNLGKGHENGGIESPHGHLKRRIKQALLLRGSNDFESIESYQNFIESVAQQHNRRNAKSIDIERQQLQPLPRHKTTDFDEITVRVASSGTINVRRATYALPSRLIGEKLRVHIYDDKLECYLGSDFVFKSHRVYPKDKNHRVRVIDYRHLIDSLKKKPQAFRYSQFREDLLPNCDYKLIWEYVDGNLESRDSCKYIVNLLSLAAENNCEESLGSYVLESLTNPAGANVPKLSDLRQRFSSNNKEKIVIKIDQHEIAEYDELINKNQSSFKAEVNYV